jgi:hypothetical protein
MNPARDLKLLVVSHFLCDSYLLVNETIFSSSSIFQNLVDGKRKEKKRKEKKEKKRKEGKPRKMLIIQCLFDDITATDPQ